MTATELINELTRIVFVLLTAITLIDFLRHRDQVRRDVALVFVGISATIIIGVFRRLTGIEAEWLSTVGTMALLAQPYLLLRVVRYFRPIPPLLYGGAVTGMIASWMIVILTERPLPAPVTLALIAYFVVIDGYAVYAFVQGAFSTVGVVRQRFRLCAAGSAFLISAFMFVGIRTALPSLAPYTLAPTQVLAMLSALAYYFGFAPPRWLRQSWQLSELRNYLQHVQIPENKSITGIVDQLSAAVTRAMGTDTVAVVLWDTASDALTLRKIPTLCEVSDFDIDGMMNQVWQNRQPFVAYKSSQLGEKDLRLMSMLTAETCMIVPIATRERAHGLLMVFLEYGSLFVDDDVRLLTIFAQQTATILENQAVLEELRRQNIVLEQRVQARTAALQRSNEELRQFAYLASHDLQEPLRTVGSYVELIEQRYSDRLDDDGHDFMNFIVSGVAQMKELIDDLLMYSRVETSERNFTQVDFQKVLDRTRQLLEIAITESDATITSDPLPQTRADEQLMRQLFQNLIGNAIKYRSTRPPEIHIGARCENNHWIFSVQDNGIGIEKQHLERIFVIFQRLHHRGQYPGTGIGLAVCKKAVELHGGRIWAEAEPGKGTTFFFTLPA